MVSMGSMDPIGAISMGVLPGDWLSEGATWANFRPPVGPKHGCFWDPKMDPKKINTNNRKIVLILITIYSSLIKYY